jgi:Uma2 family endonuclease
MTPQLTYLPLRGVMAGFRRFSVDEYHRLIDMGILTEDDDLELLEGYLVQKMSRNPPHDGILHRTLKRLSADLPPGWDIRVQSAVTLVDSEPEPDLAVVREDANEYMSRHPTAADVGLVIEVADSSLASDRSDKGRVYARAALEWYWIINLPDQQVEVYASPSGPASSPSYAQRQDYRAGDAVPVVLDGNTIAVLPVQILLS